MTREEDHERGEGMRGGKKKSGKYVIVKVFYLCVGGWVGGGGGGCGGGGGAGGGGGVGGRGGGGV